MTKPDFSWNLKAMTKILSIKFEHESPSRSWMEKRISWNGMKGFIFSRRIVFIIFIGTGYLRTYVFYKCTICILIYHGIDALLL